VVAHQGSPSPSKRVIRRKKKRDHGGGAYPLFLSFLWGRQEGEKKRREEKAESDLNVFAALDEQEEGKKEKKT